MDFSGRGRDGRSVQASVFNDCASERSIRWDDPMLTTTGSPRMGQYLSTSGQFALSSLKRTTFGRFMGRQRSINVHFNRHNHPATAGLVKLQQFALAPLSFPIPCNV